MPYSAIIREDSFCSRWKQMQRPTAGKCIKIKEPLECSVLSGMSPSFPSLRAQGAEVEAERA